MMKSVLDAAIASVAERVWGDDASRLLYLLGAGGYSGKLRILGERCFILRLENPDVDIVREAMRHLADSGRLHFEEETADE